MTNSYRWRFFRAGGFDQVKLDRGADLAHLDELDQKLWVALACPTRGIEFDTKTLDLVDTDKDGRIRAPEIIAAGADSVAVIGDILLAPDPAERATEFISMLEKLPPFQNPSDPGVFLS